MKEKKIIEYKRPAEITFDCFPGCQGKIEFDFNGDYLEYPYEINNTWSLDIKWNSKDGIKVFQAEEFKAEENWITKNGREYYPVKYLHAEFDIAAGTFRHFDGAIHFYTEEEYYQRHDKDCNYNTKNNHQLKTLSQKTYKSKRANRN